MKLFIGNISYNTTEDELRDFFAEFGEIKSCKIATDRDTGRSRGFGFIEYNDPSNAEPAMQARNGANLGGKQLIVNEARPKESGSGPRGGGGGGGRSRGGYGGGGNRSEGGRSSSRGGYSGGRW